MLRIELMMFDMLVINSAAKAMICLLALYWFYRLIRPCTLLGALLTHLPPSADTYHLSDGSTKVQLQVNITIGFDHEGTIFNALGRHLDTSLAIFSPQPIRLRRFLSPREWFNWKNSQYPTSTLLKDAPTNECHVQNNISKTFLDFINSVTELTGRVWVAVDDARSGCPDFRLFVQAVGDFLVLLEVKTPKTLSAAVFAQIIQLARNNTQVTPAVPSTAHKILRQVRLLDSALGDVQG